jgi:hypothetical protein
MSRMNCSKRGQASGSSSTSRGAWGLWTFVVSAFAMLALRDLSHDPALAEALGNMVVAWAYAEETLIFSLARVADINLNMALAGLHRLPTFESRIKFIRALISEWKPPVGFDKEAIDNAILKLSQLAGTRNHWLHSGWLSSEDKTEAYVFDYRAPLDSPRRRKPVKAVDVSHHVATVLRRADDLNRLIQVAGLDA